METELPIEALPERHALNYHALKRLENGVMGLLETIDFLCLPAIPPFLYPNILHLEKSMLENRCGFFWCEVRELHKWYHGSKDRVLAAVKAGKLDWLVYAAPYQKPTEDVVVEAVRSGHIPIMEWLFTHKYPFPSDIMDEAARGGRVDVLEWVAARGYLVTDRTMMRAVDSDKIEAMEWVNLHGCPRNDFPLAAALARGRWELIRWLVDAGFTYNFYCAPYAAAAGGCVEAVRMYMTDGSRWKDRGVCLTGIAKGKIDIIRWYIEERGGALHKGFILHAVENDQKEAMEWMMENNFPWERQECLDTAIVYERSRLVEFFTDACGKK